MAGNLITSLLSLITSVRPSAQALSSSSSNSNHSDKEHARAVEEDLERLMRTLKWIKATLYDAEEREIVDRSVKFWLQELKKIAYDAEDVLSEYRYEVTHRHVEARNYEASDSHQRNQMEYIVPISDGMVDQLNKIRSRFDEIAKDCEALQLRESDGVRRLNNKILRPPTGHMVDKVSIFGRHAEIEEVINFLLSKNKLSLLVISIVGKGGLGKSTIAQLVYKDRRVFRCFDLFGWVCVSEEFDVKRLIKATIESFSKKNCSLIELSLLQEELAKTVKGKTIMLVLDDVWNENKSLWKLFRIPFQEAKMVRILVTTRNKKVADIMQTTTYVSPTYLSEKSSWQLFQHYAWSGTTEVVPKHLVDMGRVIMRKCGGLPLAVKSIASLLAHETYEGWSDIVESDLWESNPSNDVFPAFQISYVHLPAHLKPCFLFCSMYPKDYLLNKNNLIDIWISLGYVEPRGKQKITKIGVEYYEELKGRSFLDDCSDKFSECCKLHDIIHDLARLNSRNEHYSVEIHQPIDFQKENVPQEAYHLYGRGFMGYVNEILQRNQQNLKGLRTLSMDLRCCSNGLEHQYCINNTGREKSSFCWRDLTMTNLNNFEALRVLELKQYDSIKIPFSISKLKHLRFLNITSNHLQMFPFSIGLLYNLQTLIIDCPYLTSIDEIIGNLANLQFLNIQSSKLRKLPKSVSLLSNLLRLVIKCDDLQRVSLDFKSLRNLQELTIHSRRIQLSTNTVGCLSSLEELIGSS